MSFLIIMEELERIAKEINQIVAEKQRLKSKLSILVSEFHKKQDQIHVKFDENEHDFRIKLVYESYDSDSYDEDDFGQIFYHAYCVCRCDNCKYLGTVTCGYYSTNDISTHRAEIIRSYADNYIKWVRSNTLNKFDIPDPYYF